MRFWALSFFALLASLFVSGAIWSYREEKIAREGLTAGRASARFHPGANLRLLRESFAANEFSDELMPALERAIAGAPAFYQPPFLLAAFHANRLDSPTRIRRSFEEALLRYPANGRLHLTYAEWLLTPRASAPYRLHREDSPGARDSALDHIEIAAATEPELTRGALLLMRRAGVPPASWAERLPPGSETKALLLEALNLPPEDPSTRRKILRQVLAEPGEPKLYRAAERYARLWGERESAMAAAEAWQRSALEGGLGREFAQATTSLASHYAGAGRHDEAYRAVRRALEEIEARGLPEQDAAILLTRAGQMYLGRGRLALAQSLFAEAVTLNPYDVSARLGLARTYRAAGDFSGARRELDRILEIDSDHAGARAELERLLELDVRQ